MEEDKNAAIYKKFYEDNRIALLQYESLRTYFGLMVKNVLGADYYNMGMDVYECDRISCEDITRKAKRTILQRLISFIHTKGEG